MNASDYEIANLHHSAAANLFKARLLDDSIYKVVLIDCVAVRVAAVLSEMLFSANTVPVPFGTLHERYNA
jgi:hypothetical protein